MLKGKTVTLGTLYPDNYELQHDNAKAYTGKIAEMKSKYNCTTKYSFYREPSVVVNSIKNDVMAGKRVADVLEVTLVNARDLARDGTTVDLAAKAPNIDFAKRFKSGATSSMTFGKKVYGVAFPSMGTNVMGVLYNKNLVKKYSPTNDIENLYLTGKWTFDKYEEIAKACTQDTNGDGRTDIYGITCPTHMIGIALSSNAGGTAIMQNGRVKAVMCEQAGIEALEFCKRLYDAKTWNYKAAWTDAQTTFANGEAAFFPFYLFAMEAIADTAEFELGFVPFPLGPAYASKGAQGYVSGTYDASLFVMTRIAAAEKDTPAIAAAWLNKLSEISDTIQNNYIKKMQRCGLNSTSINVYKWAVNNTTAEFSSGVQGIAEVDAKVSSSVFNQAEQPASNMAAIKELYQSKIDDYYEKLY